MLESTHDEKERTSTSGGSWQKVARLLAGALVASLSWLLVSESANIWVWLFFLPLLLGGAVAASGSVALADWISGADRGLKRLQAMRLVGVIGSGYLWFWRLTSAIRDPGIRAGVRVVSFWPPSIVFSLILLPLFIVLLPLILTLIGLAAVIWLVSWSSQGLESSGAGSASATSTPHSAAPSSGRELLRDGERIDPTTGHIQTRGLSSSGWVDTNRRVSRRSGEIEELGKSGWQGTGTRVNQRTSEVESRSGGVYWGDGQRVDPDTGVIQELTPLGWTDTNERINPKSGARERRGLMGWFED